MYVFLTWKWDSATDKYTRANGLPQARSLAPSSRPSNCTRASGLTTMRRRARRLASQTWCEKYDAHKPRTQKEEKSEVKGPEPEDTTKRTASEPWGMGGQHAVVTVCIAGLYR